VNARSNDKLANNGEPKVGAKAPPSAASSGADELHFASRQDFLGEAQYARPQVLKWLMSGNTLMTMCMVICTVAVSVMTVRFEFITTHVWASKPDGETTEVKTYPDEQAAAAAARLEDQQLGVVPDGLTPGLGEHNSQGNP
jgi:hypothetical protein